MTTTFARMDVDGILPWVGALPAGDLGADLIAFNGTLTDMRARRGSPGIAGITTIQLEVNGVAQAGTILSWTPADPIFKLKLTTIGVTVVVGDIISFRITSLEAGSPEDIIVEVNT